MVVDERGEARGGASMVDGGLVRDFGRVGLSRARGWSEWVDGEAAQLGVRRIEAGRRALAGATNDDGSSSSLHYANARKEKVADGTESFEASPRIRAPTPRSGAIANAWRRRRRAQSPVWPASAAVPSRRCTVSSFK